MNVKRYSIAGGVSLAIHAAFLFIAQEPKVYAMPAGAQSTSVSINFKAMTTPVAPPVDTPSPVVEAVKETLVPPEPKNAPIPKQAKPQPKKEIKKAKPTKKPDVLKPKKVVKKKPVQKKKVAKKRPIEKKAIEKKVIDTPQPKIAKQTPKAAEPSLEPQPAMVNRGASAQPIMVNKPSFLSRPSAPKYPRLARKRGVEGVALYEIWLDEHGNQVKQVLISSSGATMLDKSALTAIKKWQFSPHSVNGQKMAHRVQIPVRFKLDR